MKKVFHIISNREWGGGEQYVYDLAQRQLQDGWEVSVFCRQVDAVIQKFRSLQLSVYPLPLKGATDVVSAWGMARVLSKAGACTVHAHNFKDAFTACYARRLSTNRDIRVVMCRHLTREGKNGLLYRWLYRQIDGVCFDSQLSLDKFLSTSPTIDGRKLHVVHTSIVTPPTPVELAAIRQEFNIPADTVIAMYHGRLDREKGLDVLMGAVGRLSDLDFRMVLIGRGSEEYMGHLKQLIADKGIGGKIVMAGFRHPVLPYVGAADFGILSSIVQEGCPLSPQEYMSQGRPVIATNHGGQREYMSQGRNGLLVEPGNEEQLAEAMRSLISDSSMRERLGKQAKADFEEGMNYESFYQKIQVLYQ